MKIPNLRQPHYLRTLLTHGSPMPVPPDSILSPEELSEKVSIIDELRRDGWVRIEMRDEAPFAHATRAAIQNAKAIGEIVAAAYSGSNAAAFGGKAGR